MVKRKRNLVRKAVSLVASLALTAGLMPAVAFADGEGGPEGGGSTPNVEQPAISKGTSVLDQDLNSIVAITPRVFFGASSNKDWYVVSYDGKSNGIAPRKGAITLLQRSMWGGSHDPDDPMCDYYKFRTNTHVDRACNYDGSDISDYFQKGFAPFVFSAEERYSILSRTLEGGCFFYNGSGYDPDKIAGATITNATLWLLSAAETEKLPLFTRIYGDSWWLRSPGNYRNAVAIVDNEGGVNYRGDDVDKEHALRRAFHLDMGSVLLTSPAVGGKTATGLSSVNNVTNDAWKLTIKDGWRHFSVDKVTVNGSVLSVHYNRAFTGDNEYISAVIENSSGAITHYGKIAQVANDGSGIVTIDIDGKMESGDKLYVFNEQCNGDRKTDYASEFVEIDPTPCAITASSEPEAAGTVTGSGTYTKNSHVALTATANEGYVFANWTQDGQEVSNEAGYSFSAEEDRTLVAHFAKKSTLSRSVDALTAGYNTSEVQTVWYGKDAESEPLAWRVIGHREKGIAGSWGTVTLLSANNRGVTPYAGSDNVYATSTLKTKMEEAAGSLAPGELAAVRAQWLNAGGANYGEDGYDSNKVKGDGNGYYASLWPLSVNEANNLRSELRALGSGNNSDDETCWWLRSPGSEDSNAAYVTSSGNVEYDGVSVSAKELGIRPAFQLKLRSVILASAAVGGKSGNGLSAVTPYTGNEWKLTLSDSTRNSFAVGLVTEENGTYTVNYSGATTGSNEYISAVIVNSAGDITHYGRIAQATATSGVVTVNTTGMMADGSKLYIFNEQCNGDKQTDYASALVKVATSPNTLTSDIGFFGEKYNTGEAKTLWFGKDGQGNPYSWRVIGYDGAGIASAQGNATLLAGHNMGTTEFDGDGDDNDSNEYASSTLRTKIDAIAETLSASEQAAIVKRTLEGGSANGIDGDGWDGNKIAGPSVTDASLWPLSETEAFLMSTSEDDKNLRLPDYVDNNQDGMWWLRSPGTYSIRVACMDRLGVKGHGNSAEGSNVYYPGGGIRPAFNLDLDSVLFASPAEGGKPGGGLTEVVPYTGSEWKLTLPDSSRSGFSIDATDVDGDAYTIKYSGAVPGDNEYISAVIVNGAGDITHYGRIAQVTDSGSDTVTFSVNGAMDSSSRLYIFNEQCNGDKQTDFASELIEPVPSTWYTITASANPQAGGTVSGAGKYPASEPVTLKATPKESYVFVNWTENGQIVSTKANYSFTATCNKTLVANFKPIRTIVASANTETGGTVSGAGEYVDGTQATLVATPNEGYTFTSWTEDGQVVGTEATYSFEVTGNRILVAYFKQDTQIDSLTFTTDEDPIDGDAVGTPVVSVAEDGVSITSAQWYTSMDDAGAPVEGATFAAGDVVYLRIAYKLDAGYQLAGDIAANTTINGDAPDKQTTTAHDRVVYKKYTVKPQVPAGVAWKDGNGAVATWKGVNGAAAYYVKMTTEDGDETTTMIEVESSPDSNGTLHEFDLTDMVNKCGSGTYSLQVAARIAGTPAIVSEFSQEVTKDFTAYSIAVDNGTAMNSEYETLTQAIPGTRVKVTYDDAPYSSYAGFDHWEFLSGITEFDLGERTFTMPGESVRVRPIYNVYAMDMGNIWDGRSGAPLSPTKGIPFTTAFDPDGTLDNMVEFADQWWMDVATGTEIHAGSNALPVEGHIYQFYVELKAKDGYCFTAEEFDPLIIGGSEVSATEQEKTLNEDGTVMLTWGLRAKAADEKVPDEKTPDETTPDEKASDDSTQIGEDGTPLGVGASAKAADKALTKWKKEADPKGSKVAPLLLKSTKQTKSSVKFAWKKPKGAVKFVIYGNACGKKNKMKKIATQTKTIFNLKKLAGKKLKKGSYYKLIVVALDKRGKVVSTSKVVHAATKGGKVGNDKKVTVKKKVLKKAKALKKGKTLKLKAKAVPVSKKLKVKRHVGMRYESSKPKVASVSKKGVVKGRAKGKAVIYAYTQNGVVKAVKVKVK